VSKKTKKSAFQEDLIFMVEDDMADIQEMARFLTLLMAAISPAINKGETYDLVCEMLNQGVGDEVADLYGNLIRATAFEGKKDVH
jgi:isochorismate hydrolase